MPRPADAGSPSRAGGGAAGGSARPPPAAEARGARDESVELGFGSVMFDAADLMYDANVEATAAVADTCHRAGVWVEAELGEVGGKDGAHANGARTDPMRRLPT